MSDNYRYIHKMEVDGTIYRLVKNKDWQEFQIWVQENKFASRNAKKRVIHLDEPNVAMAKREFAWTLLNSASIIPLKHSHIAELGQLLRDNPIKY